MNRKAGFISALFAAQLLVIGCSEEAGEKARQLASSTSKQTSAVEVRKQVTVPPPPVMQRHQDMVQIVRGGKLYQQHCAECHGTQAEGAPNWQQPGPDGKWPPPALNGTAHAWHHPMAMLKRVIRDGTQKLGGNMPPWGDKLSEQDIDDIIAWFQAKWPDELYAAWYQRDKQAQQQGQ